MKKVIIVTGASRGIGRTIAKELAKEGNIVVANYNKSEDKAIELKKELEKEGINIDIFKADVSKRSESHELAQYVIKKYNKIDVLINNAGIDQIKIFNDITDEDFYQIINNNLFSAFCMTQEVVNNMINNKQGLIINISSIWGSEGASCESVYAMSKAAMDAMTRSLAKELGPSNIRVNSVAPGIIDTDMNKSLNSEDIKEILKEIPLGKIGNTEDVYKCVRWLIEDNYTTGQIIKINGGWSM